MKSVLMVTLILSGSLAFAGGGTIGSDTASTCLEVVNKVISTAQETQANLQVLKSQVSDAKLYASLDKHLARVQSRAPKFKADMNEIAQNCQTYGDDGAIAAKSDSSIALANLLSLKEFNTEVRMAINYDKSCGDFSQLQKSEYREHMPTLISINYSNNDLNWGAKGEENIKLDTQIALVQQLYNSKIPFTVVCEKSKNITPSYNAQQNTLTYRYSTSRDFSLLDTDTQFGGKAYHNPYASDVTKAILESTK
ncbi:hypothetical protein CIK05_13465 [Bdellovibrio sp. qaytius]|nr:hypothetical protein CIK05_13465 [Bdellovibrio sp. qaytius]